MKPGNRPPCPRAPGLPLSGARFVQGRSREPADLSQGRRGIPPYWRPLRTRDEAGDTTALFPPFSAAPCKGDQAGENANGWGWSRRGPSSLGARYMQGTKPGKRTFVAGALGLRPYGGRFVGAQVPACGARFVQGNGSAALELAADATEN